MPIVNVTLGNPYFNPHLGRPYDHPIAGGKVPGEHPLKGICRFVEATRQLQTAEPELPMIATGYTWLRHLLPYVAAGAIERGWATMIGQGRGSLAYPDSVRDVLDTGRMEPSKCCVTCSACTQIMRDGVRVGCVVHDRDIYGSEYRVGRRHSMDRLQAEAERCRQCHTPSCTHGCPTGIDVPGFIAAFAEGDVPTAYRLLRERNALPELCALVCPSECQCEGECIESVFCGTPVPIRDIQLAVCRTARRLEITGVAMPEAPPTSSVAVVGSGPGGLACAIRLLELGHSVVLHGDSKRLGGVPSETIPAERYGSAEDEVRPIIAPALENGRLTIIDRRAFTDELPLAKLLSEHDAVFMALGVTSAAGLGEMPGVVDAMSFLRQVKLGNLQSLPDRVAVLGGGNTAVDAAVSARHFGVPDVYVVYRRSLGEMPAWDAEKQRLLESGAHVLFLTQPLRYVPGEDGALASIEVARTELGPEDASGRRRPRVVEGSEHMLRVEMAIEAMGMELPSTVTEGLPQLELTDRGLVWTRPDSTETSIPKLYAGGDMVNGGATAVQAIADGMAAAQEMHDVLAR